MNLFSNVNVISVCSELYDMQLVLSNFLIFWGGQVMTITIYTHYNNKCKDRNINKIHHMQQTHSCSDLNVVR